MAVEITTADGVTVSEGARVFDFYDGHWGVIRRIGSDGWFDHVREDTDPGRGFLNGERVCHRIPPGNPFYARYGAGNPA